MLHDEAPRLTQELVPHVERSPERGAVVPGGGLNVDLAERRDRRVPGARLRRGPQVPARHQVGVDVVVHDRGVLVRPGHPVDPEPAVHVVMAEGMPQPGRLDEERQ